MKKPINNNLHVITLKYTIGLGSFLDEMCYSYEYTSYVNEDILIHVHCSKIPTWQDVWNLSKDFYEWKIKNNFNS